jgi:hypothetical protein
LILRISGARRFVPSWNDPDRPCTGGAAKRRRSKVSLNSNGIRCFHDAIFGMWIDEARSTTMPDQTRMENSFHPLLTALIAAASLCLVSPAVAQAPKVYNGITADELMALAAKEGWRAMRSSATSLSFELDRQHASITLLNCDKAGRCVSGVMRNISYHFIGRGDRNLWHWNLRTEGATGFGPVYVTLQRYLHFRGVTDQYLRDVIGQIWPNAAKSFWDEVNRISESTRRKEK